jgi:hypothetical protein
VGGKKGRKQKGRGREGKEDGFHYGFRVFRVEGEGGSVVRERLVGGVVDQAEKLRLGREEVRDSVYSRRKKRGWRKEKDR